MTWPQALRVKQGLKIDGLLTNATGSENEFGAGAVLTAIMMRWGADTSYLDCIEVKPLITGVTYSKLD